MTPTPHRVHRRVSHRLAPALGAVALAGGMTIFGAGSASGQLPPVPVPPVSVPLPAGQAAASSSASDAQALVGTFRLTGGSCTQGVRGSYFRMIQPGGTSAGGPYVQNNDSSCSDKTYTPMAPGRDGGLTTGAYQPDPNPAFDGTGGGVADRITRPEKFYAVNFSTATNSTDPQTGTKVSPPAVGVDSSGRLSGDLRAFAASWNNQHFNQGAPKPDGSNPGTTSGPSGTYKASTGAFTLEWTSQIVGGPFNNFTGQWHLEGSFASSSSSSAAGGPAATVAAASTSSPGGRASTRPATATSPSGAVSPLARTGPSWPAWLGVLPLVLGVAGLAATRRLRQAHG